MLAASYNQMNSMTTSLSLRPARSNVRWLICGLLFFATVIAYMDRGILSFLEKDLEGVIGFTTVQYKIGRAHV